MTDVQPPIPIDSRAEARFSQREKAEIMQRQSDAQGIVHCACCDVPIAQLLDDGRRWENLRRFAFDHTRARGLGGQTVVENGRAICDGPKTCHGVKSAKENTIIAKCKRLSGEASSQWSRRKKFGPSLRSNSKFPSAWRGNFR
jgi:hypothetical protein